MEPPKKLLNIGHAENKLTAKKPPSVVELLLHGSSTRSTKQGIQEGSKELTPEEKIRWFKSADINKNVIPHVNLQFESSSDLVSPKSKLIDQDRSSGFSQKKSSSETLDVVDEMVSTKVSLNLDRFKKKDITKNIFYGKISGPSQCLVSQVQNESKDGEISISDPQRCKFGEFNLNEILKSEVGEWFLEFPPAISQVPGTLLTLSNLNRNHLMEAFCPDTDKWTQFLTSLSFERKVGILFLQDRWVPADGSVYRFLMLPIDDVKDIIVSATIVATDASRMSLINKTYLSLDIAVLFPKQNDSALDTRVAFPFSTPFVKKSGYEKSPFCLKENTFNGPSNEDDSDSDSDFVSSSRKRHGRPGSVFDDRNQKVGGKLVQPIISRCRSSTPASKYEDGQQQHGAKKSKF